MQKQTTNEFKNDLKPQLSLVRNDAAPKTPRKFWIAGIFSLLSKTFTKNDLNYESWQQLEAHKHCRSHEQDSCSLRLYV